MKEFSIASKFIIVRYSVDGVIQLLWTNTTNDHLKSIYAFHYEITCHVQLCNSHLKWVFYGIVWYDNFTLANTSQCFCLEIRSKSHSLACVSKKINNIKMLRRFLIFSLSFSHTHKHFNIKYINSNTCMLLISIKTLSSGTHEHFDIIETNQSFSC